MTQISNIVIYSKPIRGTEWLGEWAPQHLYITYMDGNGKTMVISAGPEDRVSLRGMAMDPLKVTHEVYNKDHPDYDQELKKPLKNPDLAHTKITTITATAAQMEACIAGMLQEAETINAGNYDYKLPMMPETLRGLVGDAMHCHNSNTAVRQLVEKGCQAVLALPADMLFPCVDAAFKDTSFDKLRKEEELTEAEMLFIVGAMLGTLVRSGKNLRQIGQTLVEQQKNKRDKDGDDDPSPGGGGGAGGAPSPSLQASFKNAVQTELTQAKLGVQSHAAQAAAPMVSQMWHPAPLLYIPRAPSALPAPQVAPSSPLLSYYQEPHLAHRPLLESTPKAFIGVSMSHLLPTPSWQYGLTGPQNTAFQPPLLQNSYQSPFQTSYDRAVTIQAMEDTSYVARNPFLMSMGVTQPNYLGGFKGLRSPSYPFYRQEPVDDMLYSLRWHDPLRIGGPYPRYYQAGEEARRVPPSDAEVIRTVLNQLSSTSSEFGLYDRVKQALTGVSSNTETSLSFNNFKSILSHSMNFATGLLQSKLIGSYNAYHGQSAFHSLLRTFFKQIGGVATKPGVMEDLINSPQAVLDDTMILAIQNQEAGAPFSDKELREISVVLYNGIYKYSSFPFFSLHFNNDGALYPVIHPAYQNTLVGEVIGYLDYYMKGYLNGGIYPREVLENWHHSQNTDKEYLKGLLIDLKALSKAQGLPYQSLRELMYSVGLDSGEGNHHSSAENGEQRYMTSFRILSKMKGVEKEGNVLLMKPSFDVEYTIDLHPDYKEFLEQAYKTNGSYPLDYRLLQGVYATAAKNIIVQMPKFSFAKELFSKLDVINAICHYFSTLKEMGKVPVIAPLDLADGREDSKPFPKLLPPIPVSYFERHDVHVTMDDVLSKLQALEIGDTTDNSLDGFLNRYYTDNDLAFPEILRHRVKLSMKEALSTQLAGKIPDDVFLDDQTEILLQSFLPLVHYLDSEEMFAGYLEALKANIAQSPAEIQMLVDVDALNHLENFDEKIESITTLVQSIHDAMQLYYASRHQLATAETTRIDRDTEKQISDGMSARLIYGISALPAEIQAEFNLGVFDALGSFDAKMNYCEMALRSIYARSKQYYANALQAEYQNYDAAINKEMQDIIIRERVPAGFVDGIMAGLKAQVAPMVAEEKAKHQKIYESREASLNAFFLGTLDLLTKNKQESQEQHIKNTKIDEDAYQSQLANLNEFYQFRLKALEDLKTIKMHLTSIVKKDVPLFTAYKHSMLDIADGVYLKAVGTDLKIVGGVGLRLERLKTTDLPHSKAAQIQKAAAGSQDYHFSSVTSKENHYAVFKVGSHFRPVSSGFEYVLDDEATGQANNNHAGKEMPGDLSVHQWAATGNLEALRLLLTNEPGLIDTRNARGYTPLMLAAQNGESETTKYLLGHGANIHHLLPNGLNSLSLAILNGHEVLAHYLISTTAIDITNEDSNKQTALHYAIALKLTTIAKQLIEKGANLHIARQEDGFYPLHLAAELGLEEIIQAIKTTNAFDMKTSIASGKTALHLAAAAGELGAVTLLLRHGVPVDLQDKSGDTALIEAISEGHSHVAYYLSGIAVPNIVNKMKQTASLIAAKHNQFDVADRLIERGENPLSLDVEGHNYIYYLLTKGEFQRYVTLHQTLQFDVDMSFDEGSSLFVAARSGHHGLTHYLVTLNAQFQTNQAHQDLLHMAVKTDNVAYLRQYFSEEGFFQRWFNALDKVELVHFAAKNASNGCFKALYGTLDQDEIAALYTDIDILVSAIEGGNAEIILLLLKSGRDQNRHLDAAQNNVGHLAVKQGFLSLLVLLSENGVNFRALNKEGFTAYHVAILQEDKEMLQALMALNDKENWPQDLYSFSMLKESHECSVFLKEKKYTGNEYMMRVDGGALNEACVKGDFSKAKALLSTHHFKKVEGALHKAISNGHLDIVELLLNSASANVKIKIGGDDAYGCAVRHKQVTIIQFFNAASIADKLDYPRAYYTKMTDNMYVKAAILEQYEIIKGTAAKLLHALEKNNFTAMKTILKTFPVNSVFVKGESGEKPFLHYLFSKQQSSANPLIQKILFYFHKQFDPMVKDGAGGGLIHTLIQANLENLAGRMQLLYKYFPHALPQLLQQQDSEGISAIDAAINYKSTLPIILLQEDMINTKDLNQAQNTLQQLVASGDKELMTLCIEKGMDINQKDAKGMTPLMVAAKHNLLDIAKLLVANGANVEAANLHHNRALHLAIAANNTELALYLASVSQDLRYQNRDGYDVFMFSAMHNVLPLLDYLHGMGHQHAFDNAGYNALHLAALQGHTEVVAKLLDMGFDINEGSKQTEEGKLYKITALQLSMLRGQQETAAFLIKRGASLAQEDSVGGTGLEYAAYAKSESMLYFIKTLNAFYDANNQQKMMLAAVKNDHVSMIRELYLQAVPLNMVNKNGVNLLQIASQAGAKKALQFLLEQGVCVDSFTPGGSTALHFAATRGDSGVIQQLVMFGANVNLTDNSGSTPLLIASEHGHYAAVLQLLKAKASVEMHHLGHLTAAQIALLNGYTDIVKLLFIMGDTSITDKDSRTMSPYVLQELKKHETFINALKVSRQAAKKMDQNPLFTAVKLNHTEAVKLLIILHPEYLLQQDFLGKTAGDYADTAMNDLLLHYKTSRAFEAEYSILPIIPKLLSPSGLGERLELIIGALIENIGDGTLIPSLITRLKLLPVSSAMQFVNGLKDTPEHSREMYAKNAYQLLLACGEDKNWMEAANDAFFRPYQWDILIDVGITQMMSVVKNIDNEHLTQWFFAFFTPVEAHSIEKTQLLYAMQIFQTFLAHLHPNLSEIPGVNISFQAEGIVYLERANWFMEHSATKSLQAKFLHRLPSAEATAFIKTQTVQNDTLELRTDAMFVGNILFCGKDIRAMHASYALFKANALCNAATSESDYLKGLKFFVEAEKHDFTPQDIMLLARIFFSRLASESDIDVYLSTAFVLKEEAGEALFSQIYQVVDASVPLTEYMTIARLLVVLRNAMDPQSVVAKHQGQLDALKSELETRYAQHFTDKDTETDWAIDSLIKKFTEVEYPLAANEMERISVRYKKLVGTAQAYKKMTLLQLTHEAEKEAALLKAGKLETNPDLKLLAILRECIRHEYHIYPYNTQMLVVLSLLEDKEDTKGRLAEVLTGEGKSTIITLLAAYLVLSGQNVDIITSSQDLAIRDHKKYAHFFEMFHMHASHISYPNPEPKHFDAKIIYGTNYDFEFAILRGKIYNKKMFIEQDRVVIVDEVDNLFIDTALNSARISYPAMRDMSWIYAPILEYVQTHSVVWGPSLKAYLSVHHSKEYLSLGQPLEDEYLDSLIHSAKIAIGKKRDRDYVVKFDPQEGKEKVVIVDFHNTGKLNFGSRWSAGIHEFLEVLNGLQPEAESLTIASISHPSFFGLYRKIYGLTGTIGESEERAEIKAVYDVDYFDVPPHFDSQKEPLVTQFVHRPAKHYEQIISSIKQQVAAGRPVLALFQTIGESKAFSKFLTKNKLSHHVLNEMQEADESYILSKAGNIAQITVATNNAGRGTDIILSKEAIMQGGLHVIISFLPTNLRVQEQACGREGRQGQPGSCEMIISIDDPSLTALKATLISLTAEEAISKIMENRSDTVKKLSEYRVEMSEIQQKMYALLEQFITSLDVIRQALKESDVGSMEQQYHHYVTNHSGSCPMKNSVMDGLYKQGSSLIAHQTKGNWVEWSPFMEQAKEQYVTVLSQKWAECFTELDKGRKVNDNAASIDAYYHQFYVTTLQKAVEEPIKNFNLFIDEVVQVSTYYGTCIENDFNYSALNDAATCDYGQKCA